MLPLRIACHFAKLTDFGILFKKKKIIKKIIKKKSMLAGVD